MNRQQFEQKTKQRVYLFPLTLIVLLSLLAGPLRAEENTDGETFDTPDDFTIKSDQFQEPDVADQWHQPAMEADLRPGPAADFSDSAASSDFSDDNASKLLKIKFSSPRNKRGELSPSCQLKTCKLNTQQLASSSTTKVDWPTYICHKLRL